MTFREALESRALAILTGATLAGAAVDTDRDVAVDVRALPAITIYTWDDSAELLSSAGTGPYYRTTLELNVVARVADPDKGRARHTLKCLTDEIREALLRDPRLYRDAATGRADVIRIPHLRTRMTLQGENETNIGEAVLTFRVEYDDAFPQLITTPLARIVTTTGLRSTAAPPVSGPYALPVPLATTVAVPRGPAIGAIRWDAWYTPANPITQACAADLSPAQYAYRAPWFAAVAGGAVALPNGTQAIMDAECALAMQCGIDYFAFNGPTPNNPYGVALGLYLGSAQAKPKYALIHSFDDLWASGAALPPLLATAAATSGASYMTVRNFQPLIFLMDTGDADIASRFGGTTMLAAMVATLRAQVAAACGYQPYVVLMPQYPERGAALLPCGFDAICMYGWPGDVTEPLPYGNLVAQAEGAWARMQATGLPMLPTAMTGWDPSPRVVTPSVWFGGESQGSATAYYTDPAPAEMAAHVVDAWTWVQDNPSACPANAMLIYAWNEFDECGRPLAPTWVAGSAAGDTSRITALAQALIAAGKLPPPACAP